MKYHLLSENVYYFFLNSQAKGGNGCSHSLQINRNERIYDASYRLLRFLRPVCHFRGISLFFTAIANRWVCSNASTRMERKECHFLYCSHRCVRYVSSFSEKKTMKTKKNKTCVSKNRNYMLFPLSYIIFPFLFK